MTLIVSHLAPTRMPHAARSAFTLVELIIASVIVSFIVAATTASLSQAIRARDAAAARNEAFGRATAAADRIAADAENAVRDPVIESTRIAITPSGSAAAHADSLLLFSRSTRRVRAAIIPGGNDPAEGGEYEVQYRLETGQSSLAQTSASPRADTLTLWRRADPTPDEYPDGGGVAAPIAPCILSLTLQASDGYEWFDEWDSDYSGYPHLLRITVVAADDRARTTATARRTIALDRTPLPIEPIEEDPGSETGTGTSTTPASTQPR